MPPERITSSANAWYKQLRRLAHDNVAYRRSGQVWVEGDHLCRAALARGLRPSACVVADSAWDAGTAPWANGPWRTVQLPDKLFADLSTLESPARVGFVLELGQAPEVDAQVASVVLDRVQDAGNVGSILRCAAAFGYAQVLALKGTAALWSPKVLRAGMGAHFALRLVEAMEPDALAALQVPVLATSSHTGEWLHEAQLPWPCAWLFGHEGQGIGPELSQRADRWLRIAQPGGEESLNVAAAAAICLHHSAVGGTKAPRGL